MRSSDNTSKKARILAAIIGIVMLAAVAIAGTWSLSSDDIDEAKADIINVQGDGVVLYGGEDSGYLVRICNGANTQIESEYRLDDGVVLPMVADGKVDMCGFSNTAMSWDAVWDALSAQTGVDVRAAVSQVVFYSTEYTQISLGGLSGMFRNFTALESVALPDLEQAWVSLVSDVSSMFQGCSSLRSVSFPEYTSVSSLGVTTMSHMFEGCSSLELVELGLFRRSSGLSNTASMFEGCSSLEYLRFDGSNDMMAEPSTPTRMMNMFQGCTSLRALDLSGVSNSSSDDDNVLEGLGALEYVNLRNWDAETSPLPSDAWYTIGASVGSSPINAGNWINGSFTNIEPKAIKAVGYEVPGSESVAGVMLCHSEGELPDQWQTKLGNLVRRGGG